MITALAVQYKRFYRLEIQRPDGAASKFIRVETEAEVYQVAEQEDRDYIIEKMTSWLSQRWYGFRAISDVRRATEASRLLLLIRYYKVAKRAAIYTVIKEHADAIMALAPKDLTGPQYRTFEQRIIPIVDEAKKYGGVNGPVA